RGGLRADCPDRLERVLRRHAEYGALSGGQGRRRGVDPRTRNRAGQVRHHRKRRGAGNHPLARHPQLATPGGVRLRAVAASHPAEDRPGVAMNAPDDPSSLQVVLVLEMTGVRAAYEELSGAGVRFLAEPYSPPWGGHRCFAVDPDGYLIELEEPT